MKNILFLIFLFIVFFAKSSFALIEIDITRGNLNPLPVAVSPLYVESKSSEVLKEIKVGSEISKIIETNLLRSGLFNPLEKESFVQEPDIAHLKPRFEDWKLIKAQHLISGKVIQSNEKITVEFRLFDVFAQKQLLGTSRWSTRGNLGLEVAQAMPINTLVQINFGNRHRAPFLCLCERFAIMTVNGRQHPIRRRIRIGAAD